MKKFIWNFIVIYKALANYCYDMVRYLIYSNTIFSINNYEKLLGRIIAHYHVVEKGLSLKEPRFGYGKPMINSLINLLVEYTKRGYSQTNQQFLAGVASIKSYIEFHKANDFEVNDIKEKYVSLETQLSNVKLFPSSTKVLTKDVFKNNYNLNFKDLAFCRYSIRNFSEEDVDINLIKKAVSIALKTPSSCNRQTIKPYVVTDKKLIKKVLSYQTGNRGFGHMANKLIIITSELNDFESVQERNLCFIDGGMFTMSLVYSLHYLGLGTCTLNWAVEKNKDRSLRKVLSIKNSHNVIVMIAVGHLPETFKVTLSERKLPDEVIVFK